MDMSSNWMERPMCFITSIHLTGEERDPSHYVE